MFNSSPSSPEKNSEISSEMLKDLKELTGVESETEILVAIKELRREISRVPKVGRTLNKGQRPEFIIPLYSQEQKAKVMQSLDVLGISAWEEEKMLFIDHQQDLKKLALAGFIKPPPQEPLGSVSPSREYQFPLPGIETLSEWSKRKHDERQSRETSGQEDSLVEEKTDNDELPEEIENMVNRFDQGLVDESDPKFQKVIGVFPSLTLFPCRYVWEKGTPRDVHSGNALSKEDQVALLIEAKKGDDKAMRQVVSLHRGLVLKAVVRVREKFGGDADDLFQEGMIGLVKAVRKYEPTNGAAFSTYAMFWIEGGMRRLTGAAMGPISMPANAPSERSKLHKARTGREEAGEATDATFDRLERTYLLNAAFDPLESSEQNPVDASEKPSVKFREDAPGGLPRAVIDAELRAALRDTLLTLSPREERVLRMRFGLGAFDPRPTSEREEVFAVGGPDHDGMTLEEVAEVVGVVPQRVRQIEQKAIRKLRHPARQKALSQLLAAIDDASGYWRE